MTHALVDTWLMFRRYADSTVRTPQWLLLGVLQPFFYLLLFAPLLATLVGVRGLPPSRTYNVFLPGLLVQVGLFGTTGVGFSLISELSQGVVERMRVTPISRLSLTTGRVLHEMVLYLVQCTVLMLAAIPFGLRITLPEALVTLGLLALTGMLLASSSCAVALAVRRHDAFAVLLPGVTVPLFLLSGILLPLSLAPAWLRDVAAVDPLRYMVDAAREVFAGHFFDPTVGLGVVVVGLLALATTALATRSLSRVAA